MVQEEAVKEVDHLAVVEELEVAQQVVVQVVVVEVVRQEAVLEVVGVGLKEQAEFLKGSKSGSEILIGLCSLKTA